MRRSPPALGVVAALPDEAHCLAAPRLRAGVWVRLNDAVFLSLSGIGPERAGAAAAALLDQGVGALVSWGFAGALDPALRPGALVLAAQVRDLQDRRYDADAAWLDRLRVAAGSALAVTSGTLLTCPAVVRDPIEKSRLRRTAAAVAVDMESAAVAAVAQDCRLPFIAIRSISDSAAARLPVAALAFAGTDGRRRTAHGLACLARRPWEAPPLLRLALGTRRARRALRTLARLAGPRLQLDLARLTSPRVGRRC